MYNLFKILYTYIKITLKITYYHLFEIDIKNDNDRLENLKDDISNCGFMMIKSVQWLLPSYNLIYPNTKLYDILNIFYEDCNIHDIKYTEHIYYNNYKKYIYEDYNILDILGSGSIGQVYKIQNIHTNKYYALKVLHPNVEYEYTVFSIFVYILLSCHPRVIRCVKLFYILQSSYQFKCQIANYETCQGHTALTRANSRITSSEFSNTKNTK